MPLLGSINIPDPSISTTPFPFRPDYPFGFAIEPGVVVHTFGTLDAKIEQRFTMGDGVKRYQVRKQALSPTERAAFFTFWYAAGGALSRFPFARPNADGTTTTVQCRFQDQSLTLEGALGAITSVGVTLVEAPSSGPTYSIGSTVVRGPITGVLASSLLDQVQTLIPLVQIQPLAWESAVWGPDTPSLTAPASSGAASIAVGGLGAGTILSGSQFLIGDVTYATTADAIITTGAATLAISPTLAANAALKAPLRPVYPLISVSDRMVTVGGVVYQPRLLDWDGIQQTIGGSADQAGFVLGNADRVFTRIANSVDLRRADIRFSLFHVNTGTLINLWRGHVVKYRITAGPEFALSCLDGIYELTLPFPVRRVSRLCQKPFNRAESGCPYATAGSGGDPYSCDKGYETANGCQAHGMQAYFGGITGSPQSVSISDNSTGVAGFGRDKINSTSQIAETVFEQVVPEIYINWVPQTGSGLDVYANDPADPYKGLPVPGKIIEGREESDFYTAVGIVGEGPLGFPAVRRSTVSGGSDGCFYKLDNQPPHGIASHKSSDIYPGSPAGCAGLRRGNGHDPAQNNDPDGGSDQFSVSQGGSGPQSFGSVKAAGTAFVEIRRKDTKGIQVSTVESHNMTVPVRYGLPGWTWAGTTRTLTAHLTNPVWIAVNAFLKGKGLWFAPQAIQEQYLVLDKIIAAATICETALTRLIGTGQATQFRFTGIIQEEKPLRAWLQEILNNCLGNFTFDFGRLAISLRINSSAVEAFDVGNVLFQSVVLDPIEPAFNQLRINFADEEFAYGGNAVDIYNEPHAIIMGGSSGRPQYTKGTLNIAGSTTKDHTGRLASVRLCEEVGGINAAQFGAARAVAVRTTALALNVTPGMVASLAHPDCPDYPAQLTSNTSKTPPTPNFIEFRVQAWKLNKDFSITINGRTTNWDTYDVTVGPKPVDVLADPVPTDNGHPPANWGFRATTDQRGTFLVDQFRCATYASSVVAAHLDIYYCPEDQQTEMFTSDGCTALDLTIDYGTYGTHAVPGDWIQIEAEIMLVTAVTVFDAYHGVVTVLRGQAGTTAAAHPRISSTFTSHNAAWACEYTVPTGLAIQPGGGLVVGVDGSGEEAVVAEYNSATGLLRTTLPLATATDGGNFLVVPVMRRIVLLQHTINFPARFFASHANATFADEVSQPFAGIASIVGTLENTAGLLSDPVVLGPASETLMTTNAAPVIPFAMRVGGQTRYTFPMTTAPGGTTAGAFNAVAAPVAQPFERAWVEIRHAAASAGPVTTPTASAPPVLTTPASGGALTVTAGASGWETVTLAIAGFSSTWSAAASGITAGSTLAQIATSLAARFSDDDIGKYYSFAAAGPVVSITDTSGRGGPMTATVQVVNPSGGATGTLAVGSAALASPLGLVTGRRYSFAFSGSGLRSELSIPTVSTGPSTAYSEIILTGLPTTLDSRVSALEIYATDSESLNNAVFRLVASIALTVPFYRDTHTMTTLAAANAYPGPTQPSGTAILVTLTLDGNPWIQMRVPPGGSKSNVVAGGAMFSIKPGVIINANISNPGGGFPALLAVAE